MKHLHKCGAIVNIYQMSPGKGLMYEGRATVVKPVGNASDEHYMVRFLADEDRDSSGMRPTYEWFIDRDGQGDPQAYIAAFNKRIGYKVA